MLPSLGNSRGQGQNPDWVWITSPGISVPPRYLRRHCPKLEGRAQPMQGGNDANPAPCRPPVCGPSPGRSTRCQRESGARSRAHRLVSLVLLERCLLLSTRNQILYRVSGYLWECAAHPLSMVELRSPLCLRALGGPLLSVDAHCLVCMLSLGRPRAPRCVDLVVPARGAGSTKPSPCRLHSHGTSTPVE